MSRLTMPARSAWTSVAARGRRWLLLARRPVLSTAGFTLVTCAAWDVSRPLGLLVAGASCLIMESLIKGGAE